MDPEVFLSILALDAYNRGYGANVDGPLESGEIGDATIRQFEPDEQDGWQSAGFYAIAYDWNDQTVISFRGTNFPTEFTDPVQFANFIAQDFGQGWSIFTGLGPDTHAELAREFLVSVIGEDFPVFEYGNPIPLTNLTLTGHSLGGGLAGFIGSRMLAPAVVFDPVPFGNYTFESVLRDAFLATVDEMSLGSLDLGDYVFGSIEVLLNATIPGTNYIWQDFVTSFVDNIQDRWPDFSSVSGAYLEGEIASLIEPLQVILGGLLTQVGFTSLGLQQIAQAVTESLSDERAGLRRVDNEVSDEFAAEFGSPGMSELHSMSLLTMYLFGNEQWEDEEGRTADWRDSAAFVFSQVDSDTVGEAIGLVAGQTGVADPGSQLSRITGELR